MSPAPNAQPVEGPPAPSPWRAVRRLLVVRLDQLGDLLMTTPALAALREGLPAAHITLLTSRGAAVLAPHLRPIVDDWWTEDVPWMPSGAELEPGAERALVDRLAAGGFDAAIVFTVCTQSALPAALVCRMAGIPLRLAHARENPYGLLTDWAPERDHLGPGLGSPTGNAALRDIAAAVPPAAASTGAGSTEATGPRTAGPWRVVRHEVRRQLDLVGQVGFTTRDERLRFELREPDRAEASWHLPRTGLGPGTRRGPARPFVVLHPGASAASRRWPAERFGAVAAALADRGLDVLVCAGPGEAPLAEAVLHSAQAAGPTGLPGSTPRRGQVHGLGGPIGLGALAALMARSALVLTNNSGPAHLAAAVGAPLVCVYAQTNPQHAPWSRSVRVLRHDTPCSACLKSRCPVPGHPCLTGISTQAVLDAALDSLRHRPQDDEDEEDAA